MFSSVQIVHSFVSDSLRPHELQHARLPYSSLTAKACSNSCPSSQWCHPTISSSVIPFSSCLQSFPASGSFLRSQFFISGGRSTAASAFNEYSGLISFRTDWFALLAVEGPRVFFNTTVQKHQFFSTQPSFMVQLSHPDMLLLLQLCRVSHVLLCTTQQMAAH